MTTVVGSVLEREKDVDDERNVEVEEMSSVMKSC